MKTGFMLLLGRLLESGIFWVLIQPLTLILTLFRHNPKYLVLAGYVAERAGNSVVAENFFRKAVESSRKSVVPGALRWQHTAEFFQERNLKRSGQSFSHDPLFECSVKETGERIKQFAGFYKTEFIFSGLQIIGVVPSSSGRTMEIFLDNVKVRNLNVVSGSLFGKFSFRLTRKVLSSFPRNSILTLRTIGGKPLSSLAGSNSLRLSIPHGKKSNSPILSGERHIDKKGSLEPTEEELQEYRITFIAIYNDARDFFLKHFGKELFLTYGTLLGFVRQGTFISGDDDFDVGFMADSKDPATVKKETLSMIRDLVGAGFSVSFNRRGRLFRLHGRNQGVEGAHLDIHSFWEQDGKVWAHNDFCTPGKREQFVPAKEQDYGLFKAFVPIDPEAFLSAHYGPDWRVPDPAFVNYFLGKDKYVLSNLGEALITPTEYRSCLKSINGNDSDGEFISIAERPLYPLPDRDEDFE